MDRSSSAFVVCGKSETPDNISSCRLTLPSISIKIVICANIIIRKDGKYLVIKRSLKKKVGPGITHFVGGKVELNESPYAAAVRELREEAGISAKNIRCEAVVTEVHPPSTYGTWLVFYFSGDYESGVITTTDEGELFWLTAAEIKSQKLIPAVRETIDYILDPGQGTVFARFTYDENYQILTKELNLCTP